MTSSLINDLRSLNVMRANPPAGVVNSPGLVIDGGAVLAVQLPDGSRVNFEGGGGGGLAIEFDTALTYDTDYKYVASPVAVTAPLTFTRDETGAIPGGGTEVALIADGASTVDLSALGVRLGSQPYVNTAGQVNIIAAYLLAAGGGYTYAIGLGAVLASPAIVAPSVAAGNPTHVFYLFDSGLDTSGPASALLSLFTVAGHPFTAAAWSGDRTVVFTTSTPFTPGEEATSTFVNTGAALKGLNGAVATAFAGQAITNNLMGTVSILTVATPTETSGVNLSTSNSPVFLDWALNGIDATGTGGVFHRFSKKKGVGIIAITDFIDTVTPGGRGYDTSQSISFEKSDAVGAYNDYTDSGTISQTKLQTWDVSDFTVPVVLQFSAAASITGPRTFCIGLLNASADIEVSLSLSDGSHVPVTINPPGGGGVDTYTYYEISYQAITGGATLDISFSAQAIGYFGVNYVAVK